MHLCVESEHLRRSLLALYTGARGSEGRGWGLACVGGAGCGTERAGGAGSPGRGAAAGDQGARRGAGAAHPLSAPSPASSEQSPWGENFQTNILL